jgi:hypothetical protein
MKVNKVITVNKVENVKEINKVIKNNCIYGTNAFLFFGIIDKISRFFGKFPSSTKTVTARF